MSKLLLPHLISSSLTHCKILIIKHFKSALEQTAFVYDLFIYASICLCILLHALWLLKGEAYLISWAGVSKMHVSGLLRVQAYLISWAGVSTMHVSGLLKGAGVPTIIARRLRSMSPNY